MDLSKLPKLSQTSDAEKERNQAAAPVPAKPVEYAEPTGAILGAEVWISAVLGLLFVWLGGTFGRYLWTVMRGEAFHTHVDWMEGTPKAGQEVAYFELQGYTAWTDASLFLFGLALLADAVLLLIASGSIARRRWLVWAGFGLTVAAIAFNLITALLNFSTGVFPLFSAVAVAIGGYMAAYQWRMAAGR